MTELIPDPNNARKHGERNREMLSDSMTQFGAMRPIIIGDDNVIYAGNATYQEAVEQGIPIEVIETDGSKLYAIRATHLSEDQLRTYGVLDNRVAELAEWDTGELRRRLDDGEDLSSAFEASELSDLLFSDEFLAGAGTGGGSGRSGEGEGDGNLPHTDADAVERITLVERFVVPPFTVLDARQGYWQDRKRDWIATGIQSEIGRGENLVAEGDGDPDDALLYRAPQVQDRDYYRRQNGTRPPLKRGLAYGMQNVGSSDRPDIREKAFAGKPLTYRGAADEDDFAGEAMIARGGGTSIFDPVLCELTYRWFTAPGDQVLDPFAGGSVRGIVAGMLGRRYLGIDLAGEQIKANRLQTFDIMDRRHFTGPDGAQWYEPEWIEGDSFDVLAPGELPYIEGSFDGEGDADLIFTCPPYADLEVYSDHPADLSNMPYEEFIARYRSIIARACERLKRNRFAAIVIGDVRDKKGNYRNLVSDTIDAFLACDDMHLYNEAVLITSVGSLSIRAGKQMQASRKLGKAHQNVLVFVKGDGRKATDRIGPVLINDPFLNAAPDEGIDSNDEPEPADD